MKYLSPPRLVIMARVLFAMALAFTLICLLSPADVVLAAKNWAALWLPLAAALDAADASAHADKLVHAGLFTMLGFLAARAWLQPGQRSSVVVVLLLLGAATEVLQGFIPGRGAALGDWLADALGLAVGFLMAPPVRPVRPRAWSWQA